MIPQSSNEFPGGLRPEAEKGRKDSSPEISSARGNSVSPEKLKAVPSSIRLDQGRTSKEPSAKEPSMDEILASIRKIVSDDVPPARATGRSAAKPAEAAVPPAPATRPQKAAAAAAGDNGGSGSAKSGDSAADIANVASLLSPAVRAEAAASFAALNQAVLAKNSRTIEDVVQELLSACVPGRHRGASAGARRPPRAARLPAGGLACLSMRLLCMRQPVRLPFARACPKQRKD